MMHGQPNIKIKM